MERVPDGGGTRISLACNVWVRWLDTPLLRAAHAGLGDRVRQLVSDGAAVEEQDTQLGFRALHFAAEAGHLSVIETLVGLGADAGALSSEGWSPLGLAADRGHADCVTSLHSLGVPEEGRDDNATEDAVPQSGVSTVEQALTRAAERGHLQVVDILATRRMLPLSTASAAGHASIVARLLALRANPRQVPVGHERAAEKIPGRQEPLHIAACYGHASVTRLLIDARADPDARNEMGQCPAHMASDSGHVSTLEVLIQAQTTAPWDLDAVDKQGASPLHCAVGKGHTTSIAQLVNAGASMDVSASGSAPGRPLYWAAKQGHAAVMETLLELGADPAAGVDFGSQTNEAVPSPMKIVRKGTDVFDRVHFADVLIKRKVRADAAGEAGGSPLHAAAAAGQLVAAEALERRGAPAAAADEDGGTPQHWAAANGHAELLAHLFARGAEPSPADREGGRPLHDAAWSGHEAATAALLTAGAPACVADAAGMTPLHAAATLGHARVAELLLEHGAERDVLDLSGRSPADLALSSLRLLQALRSRSGYGQQMAARFEQVAAVLGVAGKMR